jgi:nucleoside-diphosphate-sugar epimerase
MKTRVLLIGASGIIGGDLLDTLAAQSDFEIVATRRHPPKNETRKNVNWLAIDLTRAFDLSAAIQNADWIILNAASKNAGLDLLGLEELRLVNIDAVSRIVSAIGKKRLIFISSLSLLRRPFSDPITERDPVSPSTPYAATKFWGETLVRQLPHHCILRISSPVPRHLDLLDGTVLRRWLEIGRECGTITFHGQGLREQDFLSTADFAQACIHVIQTNAQGLFHIGSGKPVSMRNLAKIIQERFPGTLVKQDATKDGLDHELWRVDISHARSILGYTPEHDAAGAIDRLITATYSES